MTKDYYIWQDYDAEQKKRVWNWEIVDVDDDGNETTVIAGMKDTREEARAAMEAAMKARR